MQLFENVDKLSVNDLTLFIEFKKIHYEKWSKHALM